MTDEATADATRVALDVLGGLERAGMKCALGGSLALGLWGVPRGTKDADLNVFVGADRYAELQSTLERLGCSPRAPGGEWSDDDRAAFVRQATDGEAAVVYKNHVRVDLFVPSIDFYDEAEATLKELELADGRRVPVLSAEALSVFKLLFFREKDLLDLKRLVARQGPALDHGYVRRQIASMLGEEDERIAAWDAIVGQHGGSA